MSDPRRTPDLALKTKGMPMQVRVPVSDLCRTPGGPRDRQILYGEAVVALEERGGWRYVQADKDGYCGHVRSTDLLKAGPRPTHRIAAAASHCYAEADLKSHDLFWLSHGSQIALTGTSANFGICTQGHIPLQHLRELSRQDTDPAATAALFIGTPYLWGGNSSKGIDCSGLVQAACSACGIACPGDSDMQETDVGQAAPPGTPPQRNDLLFWKGHVAWVWDPDTILHANAHSMSVTFEPLDTALKRIAQQGGGEVTAHRRL